MENIKKYLAIDSSVEKFEKLSSILIHTQMENERRKRWENILENDFGIERKSSRVLKKVKIIAVVLIIGLLAFLLFQSITNQNGDADTLTNKYIAELNVFGDPEAFRKGETDLEELRLEANQLYVNRKFEESAKIWSQLINSRNVEEIDKLYLAICHLKTDHPDLAASLSVLESVNSTEFNQEILWVLALGKLKIKDTKASQTILKKIIEFKSYKYLEAKELLTKIK